MAQVVAYIPMFHPTSPTLGPWVATGGEGCEGATGGASVEAMDGEFLPLKLGGK